MFMSNDAEAVRTKPRGPALSACGLRRTDAPSRMAEALADGWVGLPPGITRWRLAAALRAAARSFRLSAGMLRLIEHYIDLSYDQDWTADSEPVICRPLVETAEALSLGERQVRNLERALLERGLLAFRDSGNHHRRGRRDRASGKLIYAYGPSLAPLGARAEEIIALAASARTEIAAARRTRLAISALRRRLRAGLAAAMLEDIDVADLSTAYAAQPSRITAGLSKQALNARRDALARLVESLDARTTALRATDAQRETASQPAIFDRHKTYTSTQNPMNGSIRADSATKAPPISIGRTRHGCDTTPIALALSTAGPLIANQAQAAAIAAGRKAPNWRDLVDGASNVAPLLGLNQAAWGAACQTLGRNGAALAAIIIENGLKRTEATLCDRPDAKPSPIRAPAAYLQAMLARATRGELHLDRSIRALARRADAADNRLR